MKKIWIISVFLVIFSSSCINNKKNAANISENEQVKTIVNFDIIESKDFKMYFKEKHDDSYILEDIIKYNGGNTDVLNEESKNNLSNNLLKKRMIILKFNL